MCLKEQESGDQNVEGEAKGCVHNSESYLYDFSLFVCNSLFSRSYIGGFTGSIQIHVCFFNSMKFKILIIKINMIKKCVKIY